MISVLKKRFSSRRVAKIVGWTTAAVTWGAVGMTAGLAASKDGATPATPAPVPTPATESTTTSVTQPAFPDQPEGGLIVLRGIPSPEPPPATVVRRVVIQQAAAPAVAPAPPAQSSGGS